MGVLLGIVCDWHSFWRLRMIHIIENMEEYIMETNQQLLVDLAEEYGELQNKLGKLRDFCVTDDYQALPWEHKHLLLQQTKEMYGYLAVLADRIEYVKSTTTGFESIFNEFFKGTKGSKEEHMEE